MRSFRSANCAAQLNKPVILAGCGHIAYLLTSVVVSCHVPGRSVSARG